MALDPAPQDGQNNFAAPSAPPMQTALLVDESGYLSSHSLAVLSFLGYARGQAPKRINLLKHFASPDQERAGRALGQSLTGGKEHQGIYTMTRADGRSFTVHLSCAPCHCSGRPSGLKVSLSCF